VGFISRAIRPMISAECRFILRSFSLKSKVMRMSGWPKRFL
jgi:hypothetical protein